MRPFLPSTDLFELDWYSPAQPSKAGWAAGFAGRIRPLGRVGNRGTSAARRFRRVLGRWRPGMFVLALAGTMALATLLPCRGVGASVMGGFGSAAIGLLFFLHGARLPREAIFAGSTNWRLHLAAGVVTFGVLPVLGSAVTGLFPHALTPTLVLGVLFLCALPSSVQSSIALTSVARGNVAGAACAATLSNLTGLLLTPLVFGFMSHLYCGAIHYSGLWKMLGTLLAPLIAGHLMRPWVGAWAARNCRLLAVTDRAGILLVVYTAFSAAVMQGIWQQLPLRTLGALGLVVAALLATALVVTQAGARVCGFGRPDRVAVVFCGAQKSLAASIPIASVLFSGPTLGIVVLPIMLYHPLQLMVCTWLARRLGERAATAEAPRGEAWARG